MSSRVNLSRADRWLLSDDAKALRPRVAAVLEALGGSEDLTFITVGQVMRMIAIEYESGYIEGFNEAY